MMLEAANCRGNIRKNKREFFLEKLLIAETRDATHGTEGIQGGLSA
jgi:hypothetical protein